jgi:hypothetical protein
MEVVRCFLLVSTQALSLKFFENLHGIVVAVSNNAWILLTHI